MPRGQREDGEDHHEPGRHHTPGLGESKREHDDQRGHKPVGRLERKHPDCGESQGGSKAHGSVEGYRAAGLEVTHYAAENEEDDIDPQYGAGIHAE
jgi:hypothetical protein